MQVIKHIVKYWVPTWVLKVPESRPHFTLEMLIFEDFRTLSENFWRFSKIFPKARWMNVSKHFLKISEDYQRFPKITEDCRRFLRKIWWCFNQTSTHLSAILRNLLCNHSNGDLTFDKGQGVHVIISRVKISRPPDISLV